MMMTKERYALVTEGRRGIGKAICLQLASIGYNILINYDQYKEEAEAIKYAVEKRNKKAQLLHFDSRNPQEIRQQISNWLLTEENACIEVLVNNIVPKEENIPSYKGWGNIDNFHTVSKAVLEDMSREGKGKIINIVSDVGGETIDAQARATVMNAALEAATKFLSIDVGQDNVTVNTVSTGYIEGAPIELSLKKNISRMLVVKRFGTPEEVGALVGFLASDKANYISGQVISLNGGGWNP